jgi:hypothetical protein
MVEAPKKAPINHHRIISKELSKFMIIQSTKILVGRAAPKTDMKS